MAAAGAGAWCGWRVAAADDIDAATDDQAEREMLWHLLAGSLFLGALAEAGADARASIMQRLSEGLWREGCPGA